MRSRTARYGEAYKWDLDAMLTGSCHCGRSGWTLKRNPGVLTACNCTLCRRYGTLWAYDFENERVRLSGPSHSYVRSDEPHPEIEVLFCRTSAGVLAWRALHTREDGRRRVGVNVRLDPPEAVADLTVEHLDGLDTFEPLPTTAGKFVTSGSERTQKNTVVAV